MSTSLLTWPKRNVSVSERLSEADIDYNVSVTDSVETKITPLYRFGREIEFIRWWGLYTVTQRLSFFCWTILLVDLTVNILTGQSLVKVDGCTSNEVTTSILCPFRLSTNRNHGWKTWSVRISFRKDMSVNVSKRRIPEWKKLTINLPGR